MWKKVKWHVFVAHGVIYTIHKRTKSPSHMMPKAAGKTPIL